MEITVRNLKTTDLPKIIKMIRTLDLDKTAQEEAKRIFSGEGEPNGLQMLEFILAISETLLSSDDFLKVLAGTVEPKLEIEEIRNLDVDLFIEIILSLWEKESTKRFLKLIAKSIGWT